MEQTASHENEYDDAMVRMLEEIWGAGYMAPGGPGNVARMLDGLETHGRRVLDIGCGLGGPAREMARTHGAMVTGIDLEAPLLARATADAAAEGLGERCEFRQVEPGRLPFGDDSFDIVISAGAMTQTADKATAFAEVRRVLRPGGWFSAYDWMRIDGEYSAAMRYWFECEGLTYEMVTEQEQAALLRGAGFGTVRTEDATAWYQRKAHEEYARIRDALAPALVESLGQAEADHFVENWRAMVEVIDRGEMRQVYSRGRAPGLS